MNTALLIQIFLDVILFIGITVVWVRLSKPAKDDPRMSRGLQLLQSKIVVLEDLSDRTDHQVKQLTALIDQKSRLLQNKIIEAEHQVQKVDQAVHKSKEVAEIFQDKIPHQEIIERQNTIKYVKAAKLANSGKSVDEIANEVDLPIVQIELIAKLNRNQLVFDEEALPEWAQENSSGAVQGFGLSGSGNIEGLFESSKEEYSSLKRLGQEFRNAVAAASVLPAPELDMSLIENSIANESEPSLVVEAAKNVTSKIMNSKLMNSAGELFQQVEAKAKDFIDPELPPIKKVERPNPPSLTTPPPPLRPSPVRSGTIEIRRVEFPRVNVTPAEKR